MATKTTTSTLLAELADGHGRKDPSSIEGCSNTNQKSKGANDLIVEDLEKIHSEAPTSKEGEIDHNDPFETSKEGETSYKTLTWWKTGMLLVAETISLGILSLPKVMAVLGFLPGVLVIVGLGIVATYTGYTVSRFKLRHMGIHSLADAAGLIFGPIGKWVVEIMQILVLIFIMAAHILTFTVEMNVLTKHSLCTIVFGVIGTVVSFILTLPRTFNGIAWLSCVSCLSITAAIIITMAGVGTQHPQSPETYLVTPSTKTTFSEAAMSVSNVVVAYVSHLAFFGFISEMKTPTDFPKALAMLQTAAISFYLIVAITVYRFVGYDVHSPALTSASPLIRKIAWGVAMPTIVVAGVVNASIVVKNVYVRVWRDWLERKHVMNEKSFRAYGSWVALCAGSWVFAWVIASAIPVFSDLLGLLGALFCSWFSMGLPACFWFHMYRGEYFRDWKRGCLFVVNACILLICCVVCVAGTYGSAKALGSKGKKHASFSCADNSD